VDRGGGGPAPAPAGRGTDPTLGIDVEEEEVPGESYVPEWESLQIEATTAGKDGDIAVVSLRGIIDTVSAESLRAALARVISGGRNKIVVDMSQVEYVSSGGWGTFTERLRELRRSDGDVKLFGMDPDVYYVFTMLGFNIVLSSFDILSDAIEDFESGARPSRLEPTPPGEAAAPPPSREEPAAAPPPREEAPATAPLEGVTDIDLSSRDAEKIVRWENAGEGVLIAHLTGFFESSAVNALTTTMMQALASQPRKVLFDLSAVDYISSTGWGQFAQCLDTMREWGGEVALYGLSPDLTEIYSCLEFSAFIKAYHTRQDALAAAAEPAPERQERESAEQPPKDITEIGAVEIDEPMSVDDILGMGDEEAARMRKSPPPEYDPTIPELQRWPGERVFDDDADAVPQAEGPTPAPGGDEDEAERPAEDEIGGKIIELPSAADTGDEDVERPASPETPADDDERVEPPTERVVPSDESDKPHLAPEGPSLVDRFVDIGEGGRPVDVESAVTDKNIDQDERLREMGWDEYGERLRRRIERRKKKED
jgi:anti-anti-sigma factor